MGGGKSYKSFRFKAGVVWEGGRRGLITSVGKPDVMVGSPPEFKGEAGVWSPEELLVSSVNTCLMLTYLALAQARGLEIASYESSAEGWLEHTEDRYRITEVSVQPAITLKSPADLEKARSITERVEEQCFMTNSVSGKVKFSPQFKVGAEVVG